MYDSRDIRRISLPNALVLSFREESRRYFGDYHLVRVVATVMIPLDPSCLVDEECCREARGLLPDPLAFSRVLEKMGVPSAEVPAARDALIDDFLDHAGGYLGSSKFPARFVRGELARVTARRTRRMAPGYGGA